MPKYILLVGVGGMVGSIVRYLITLWLLRLLPGAFPMGTFAVNIVGSFLIGLGYGLALRHGGFTPGWQLLTLTGFCGGFTTFSTFSFDNLRLLQAGQYVTFSAYALASLGLGLLAVLGGWLAARL